MSGVLVVMEQRERRTWNRMSLEALAAGQQLGGEAGRGVLGCS